MDIGELLLLLRHLYKSGNILKTTSLLVRATVGAHKEHICP